MRVEAWPFLVGRNKLLGYQTIVSPQFLSERHLGMLLAESAGGDDNDPGNATYRAILGSEVGDFSLIFRAVRANAQDYDIEENGLLRDRGGRPIRLFEGFVVKGVMDRLGDIAITHDDLKTAHNHLKEAYREFWYADEAFPERTSRPFSLQTNSNPGERVLLKQEDPFVVNRPFRGTGKNLPTRSVSFKQQPRKAGVPSFSKQIRIRTILLTIISLALLATGIIIAINQINQSTPTKTLNTFCTAINNKNYQTAYNQLSTNFQTKVSPALFSSFFAGVSTCSYSSLNQNGSSATAKLSISKQTNNDQVTLIKDSTNNWKINNDVTISAVAIPTTELDAFCNDLRQANYHDAWNQLTSNLQTEMSISEDISMALFKSFFPNVTSCMHNLPTLSGDNATATLRFTYSGQTEDDPVNLIRVSNNNWKLDMFTNFSTPTKTLNAFCNGLVSQDYQTAWDQMSSDRQMQYPEEDFANDYKRNQEHDIEHGRVTSCSVSNVNVNESPVKGTLSYTFSDGTMRNLDYALIDQDNIWKINS